MDIALYYQDLATRRQAIMAQGVADDAAFRMHISSHNILKDFDLMTSVICGPEHKIMIQACREYQYSLDAVLFGNYRHAFSSLRLAFELASGAIYFSANQMKMHLWLSGHADLKWGELTNPDNGVFSVNFIKAFNPGLSQYRKQYCTMASTVYRECSEYVHGNPDTHDDVQSMADYDSMKFQNFHDKVETVWLCILFQFISRYLRDFDITARAKTEHLVLEKFGQLPEVRCFFESIQK